MRLSWKRQIFPIIVLATMVGIGIYYYPILPKIVPSHFNLQGRADGWMSKPAFYAVMGGVVFGIYLLLTFLPAIDPLKKKIEPRLSVVMSIRDVLMVFFAALFFLSLQAAHEGVLRARLLQIVLGLLFVILGNYMPKIPQNWFLGIRTPWTISSARIWKKTHILGGWLFMLAGLIFIVAGSFGMSNTVPIVAIIAAGGISILYSFYLYKFDKKGEADQ